MNTNRPVRVIKRGERREPVAGGAATTAATAVATDKGAARVEREMRTVVSGWVVEHRQRAEEFRQSFTALFRGMGTANQGGAA